MKKFLNTIRSQFFLMAVLSIRMGNSLGKGLAPSLITYIY